MHEIALLKNPKIAHVDTKTSNFFYTCNVLRTVF